MISASTLGSFLVCRTRPFIQRILEVFGIEVTTPAMRRGSAAHAQVQNAFDEVTPESDLTFTEALARKEFLLANEVHLIDEPRRLHGHVDLMVARNGKLAIIELKNSSQPSSPDPTWGVPVYASHGMQVNLYGILGKTETGATPLLFLSYMAEGGKAAALDEIAQSRDPSRALDRLLAESVAVPHGPEQRARVLQEVQAFQRAERLQVLPEPGHNDPFECQWCSVRSWCPRRLDEPGRYVALDPRKLPEGV